jgi:hypothetical protein
MGEREPSGYSGGGTSNTGEITGAGGGAGTKGFGGPAEGNHPQAPAPTERRDGEPEERARDDDRRSG